jgi:hypothetical protein
MNDPRRTTTIGPTGVTSFPVNDRRALDEELETWRAEHAFFDALPFDQREALIGLVHDALTHMARDPGAWLPEAMVARSDSSFGFFVLWENGHLDEAVLTQRTRARHALADCRADLERLADD